MKLIPIELREGESLNDWALREYKNYLYSLKKAYKEWKTEKVKTMLNHLDNII